MRTLHTEIDIAATPETVWAILTDFAAYGEWNPFISELHAPASIGPGTKLRVRLQPPGGRAMTLRPRVLAYEPPRTLRWLGHLGIRGLFDGEHSFVLEPTAGGTRFVQSERFTGVLVPLVWKSVGASTRAGFEAMNDALAARAALVANGA
jgi:hypothetical protein